MYLSRVRVATEGLTMEALGHLMRADAYGNHQLLWRLFPDAGSRPFLFRQELERHARSMPEPRGMPLFYVLSRVEPEPVPGLLDCEVKPFQPQLHAGEELAFRLRANPVVARREEGRKNARHHDVLMDAKREARASGTTDRTEVRERMESAACRWLSDVDRQARAGYRLLAEPRVNGYRQHAYRRKRREIRFSSVDYEGVLEVADPERFLRSLTQGIGRSRAFGCGMWMIRRV